MGVKYQGTGPRFVLLNYYLFCLHSTLFMYYYVGFIYLESDLSAYPHEDATVLSIRQLYSNSQGTLMT